MACIACPVALHVSVPTSLRRHTASKTVLCHHLSKQRLAAPNSVSTCDPTGVDRRFFWVLINACNIVCSVRLVYARHYIACG